jgi:UDP-N-acetylmuramoyl-tripeptide--D-alanyl-D-alanine ligase
VFSPYFYIFLPLSFVLLPVYFVVADICLFPLDVFLKKRIISKAKKKISSFPHLKVIAITGSYGKTTTKEILKTTLTPSFRVLATEGTKNTPLGISRLILDELNSTHEIFIVEM